MSVTTARMDSEAKAKLKELVEFYDKKYFGKVTQREVLNHMIAEHYDALLGDTNGKLTRTERNRSDEEEPSGLDAYNNSQ